MELQVTEIKKLDPVLLDELTKLETEAFGEGGLNEWTLPVIVKYGKVFALKEGSKTCGLAELIRGWANPANVFLVGFSVKKGYREKGFGGYFLKAILSRLKGAGVKSVLLTVSPKNIAAFRLYEQFGFVEIAFNKNEYGRGRHRKVMKLDLGA